MDMFFILQRRKLQHGNFGHIMISQNMCCNVSCSFVSYSCTVCSVGNEKKHCEYCCNTKSYFLHALATGLVDTADLKTPGRWDQIQTKKEAFIFYEHTQPGLLEFG